MLLNRNRCNLQVAPPLRIMIREDCFEKGWADEAAYAVLDTIDSQQPYLTHDMVGATWSFTRSVSVGGSQKHAGTAERASVGDSHRRSRISC